MAVMVQRLAQQVVVLLARVQFPVTALFQCRMHYVECVPDDIIFS